MKQIYKRTGKKKVFSPSVGDDYEIFEIKGKPNFNELESLKEQGIKRDYPTLSDHRTDPKETWVYSSSNVTIVIYANYEEDYHEVHIVPKEDSDGPKTIKNAKLALEERLNIKLNEKRDLPNLLEDVGEN
jgi:DNA polymerase II large subunit